MIRVYHQIHSINGPHFEMVAEVKGDSLDRAYTLTNHIDNDWALNTDVKAMPGNHRSTSVGDLLLLCTPDGTHGECHVVEPWGFTRARTEPEQLSPAMQVLLAKLSAAILTTRATGRKVSTSLRSVVARLHKLIGERYV